MLESCTCIWEKCLNHVHVYEKSDWIMSTCILEKWLNPIYMYMKEVLEFSLHVYLKSDWILYMYIRKVFESCTCIWEKCLNHIYVYMREMLESCTCIWEKCLNTCTLVIFMNMKKKNPVIRITLASIRSNDKNLPFKKTCPQGQLVCQCVCPICLRIIIIIVKVRSY